MSSTAWGQPAEGATDEDPSGVPYAAGELIVTYEERTPESEEEAVERESGGEVEEEIPQIETELFEFPEVKNERSEEARKQALARAKQALE